MQRYILRRLILSVPTILGMTLVVFTLTRLMPGDIVSLMAGDFGAASQETRNAIMEDFGLHRNPVSQYLSWLWRVIQGDLGSSLLSGRSVVSEVAKRLPISLELGFMALFFTVAIGVPLGVLSAVRQNSLSDYIGRSAAIGFLAAPNFWIALLVIALAGRYFKVFVPPASYVPFTEDPAANLKLMFFPALLTGASSSGALMRYTRTAMLEVMRQDYIRTARAKGLREAVVVRRHALKNAMIPVVTIIGASIPGIITGSIILEQVYSIPGMGRYYLFSVNQLDFPVVQGVFLIYGVAVVFINIVVDVTYSWINPRIRFE